MFKIHKSDLLSTTFHDIGEQLSGWIQDYHLWETLRCGHHPSCQIFSEKIL